MKKINFFSIKAITISLAIGSISLPGIAQAHHNDEFLSLAPFIIYSVLNQSQQYPRHQHYRSHRHHQRPRQRNHSHDGYSHKRKIRKHHRH